MGTYISKSEWRSLYLSKRAELKDIEHQKKSLAIKDRLFSKLMMHRYDRIHTYLPVLERQEVDTRSIVETLHRDFPVSVYVPKIQENGILSHHLITDSTPLLPNRWNVPEPTNEGISSSTFFDTDDDILVIVPLLVYDKAGNRIGYGKGYYDRFLSSKTANTTTVGLSFFEPEELFEDAEDTDIPLDYVFTPERVWDFS